MDGHKIIIGLNANLNQPSDNEFLSFLSACNLIDVIKQKDDNPTATHKSGNKLDLIASTSKIHNTVIVASTPHENVRASSDHSVCYINFGNILFTKNTNPVS